jgi:hypothetical protein
MEGQPAATISRKWHQTTLLKHFCILTYLGFDPLQRFCMAGCETAWHLRLFQSLVFFSCIFHQGAKGHSLATILLIGLTSGWKRPAIGHPIHPCAFAQQLRGLSAQGAIWQLADWSQ